ncbi:MAG: hypothetical protein DRG34_07605, partial [Deltaproteobacteria bacterium]
SRAWGNRDCGFVLRTPTLRAGSQFRNADFGFKSKESVACIQELEQISLVFFLWLLNSDS